jgi:hypothetical protein
VANIIDSVKITTFFIFCIVYPMAMMDKVLTVDKPGIISLVYSLNRYMDQDEASLNRSSFLYYYHEIGFLYLEESL